MKHRKKLLTAFALGCLLMAGPLMAQDSKNLTLQDAVQLSLKNSKELKNSRAKVDEATAVLHQAKDGQLPDFKISGSYLRLANPDISLHTGSKPSTDTTSGSSSLPKVNQAAYGIASISYPIYAGNKIKYGIESAKYLLQAASLDVEHDAGNVIINTIGAYINLYKAKAAVSLVEENLRESRKRDTDFANLEKNGVIARNDLLKAQLQTSNIELSLLDAENNWKLANVNMDLMLGLPENTVLAQDSASMQAPGDIKTIDDYEQLALQNRRDMKALAMRTKAAGTGIKLAKGDYYPSVALTGGYVAIDVPGLVSVLNAIDVGVGVQYNLSSLWKTKAKVEQATAKENEYKANEEMLNDNMHYQINEAYEDYLLSQKKIDVYAKAIEQANENYKITQNKYNNTLATTTDLLDADVAQLQARLNYAFAKADAIVAFNKLKLASGILTDQINNK